MSTDGPAVQDVRHRLGGRLRRRYLRWFARQPVESVCLSEGWRGFWRSYRRRTNAFFESRLFFVLMACVAIGGLLFILGTATIAAVRLLPLLPGVFFAAPENHTFANPAQRAAVAMTRLTFLQSVFLPLFFFLASRCFYNLPRLQDGSFYERSASSRLIGYRIVFLCFLACSAAVSVGATIGHGASVCGMAASLTMTGCLGWFAWAIAKRLMAVRWLPWMLSSETALAAFCVFLFLLIPVFINFWFGSPVLRVSRYLEWLGPAGWVNGLLLDLGMGKTQNLWPLGICCIVGVVLGYRLNVPTATW